MRSSERCSPPQKWNCKRSKVVPCSQIAKKRKPASGYPSQLLLLPLEILLKDKKCCPRHRHPRASLGHSDAGVVPVLCEIDRLPIAQLSWVASGRRAPQLLNQSHRRNEHHGALARDGTTWEVRENVRHERLGFRGVHQL